MKKIIFLILLAVSFSVGQSLKVNGVKSVTKSGTPIIRFKVNDTTWTAFNNDAVGEFIKNKMSVENLEKQLAEYKKLNDIYTLNETYYDSMTVLYEANQKDLKNLSELQLKRYGELFDDLIQAESEKYTYAIYGFTVGITAGVVLTSLLVVSLR